jgi:radical SAM protein with 4Fe4S-binding SPASM domain
MIIKGFRRSIKVPLIQKNEYKIFNNIDFKFSQINCNKQKNQFSFPSIITNSIIEIDSNNINFKNLNFLNWILCKNIVIEFVNSPLIEIVKSILNQCIESNVHQITIIINHYIDDYYSDNFIENILCNRLNKVIIFNSPFNHSIENSIFFYNFGRQRSIKKYKKEFYPDLTLILESYDFHTYFNCKLYIGTSGEIKNAPECDEIFGNIKDINNPEELKQIIKTQEFQKYWNVHKDIQDVCKDCEFRYMCVDNKIPYQRSENEWYHKLECNYNPYIAKWEGEEGYKTLAECGVISNKNGFSIDHDKIAEINKELWGE